MRQTKNGCTYYLKDDGQIAMFEVSENRSKVFNDFIILYTDMTRIRSRIVRLTWQLQDFSTHLFNIIKGSKVEGLDGLSFEETVVEYNNIEAEHNKLLGLNKQILLEMGTLFGQMPPHEQAWVKTNLN